MNQTLRQRNAVRSPRSDLRANDRRRFGCAPMSPVRHADDSRPGHTMLMILLVIGSVIGASQIDTGSKEHARIRADRMECAAHHQSFVMVNDGDRDDVMCVGEAQ
jgi:hypothetical protein